MYFASEDLPPEHSSADSNCSHGCSDYVTQVTESLCEDEQAMKINQAATANSKQYYGLQQNQQTSFFYQPYQQGSTYAVISGGAYYTGASGEGIYCWPTGSQENQEKQDFLAENDCDANNSGSSSSNLNYYYSNYDAASSPAAEHCEMNGYPPLCVHFLDGICRFGDSCHHLHAARDRPISDDSLWESKTERFRSRQRVAGSASCEICQEDVVHKGRRFGLLENCNCVFCLQCIRAWRSQNETQDRSNLRRCPVCRVETFVITPCDSLLLGEEKVTEIRRYREKLGEIPCKNDPQCQFGESCYYKHEADAGTSNTKNPRTENIRLVQGADGKLQCATTQVSLADYVLRSTTNMGQRNKGRKKRS